MIARPDFIKCDVEGAELMVFTGGRKTLDCVEAPIILFEAREDCSRGFCLSRFAAVDFLNSLSWPSYQLFEVEEGGGLTPLQVENSPGSNLLAVPQVKLPIVEKSLPIKTRPGNSVLASRTPI